MTAPTSSRIVRVLPFALLDPPELDERLDRPDERLEEIARDIQANGLIYPLIVFVKDERFEIVDGETRRQAMRRVGLTECECLVYATKDKALESITFRANHFRIDPTPADEAVYFSRLYAEQFHEDIEAVARFVGKKVDYVDGRIQLMLGDELVFDALRKKQIPIVVAQQLNKCDDGQVRRMFLLHAIEEGASGTAVARWVNDWRIGSAGLSAQQLAPPSTAEVPPSSDYHPLRCAICGKVDPRHFPKQIAVHHHCWTVFVEPMLETAAATTGGK